MAGILVRDLRVTLLWTETRVDLLQEPIPDVPLAALGRPATYAALFEECQANERTADGFLAPWPSRRGNRFWQFYLEGHSPPQISGSYAWKHLVPLRWDFRQRLEASWLPGGGMLDGFFYPFGTTLAATVRIAPEPSHEPLPLFQAVEFAHRVWNDRFERVVSGAPPLPDATISQIASEGLDQLRETAYGAGTRPGKLAQRPFTVVTFVNAEGVTLGTPPPEDGDIHRCLEALTMWRGTWRDDVLPRLADTITDIKRGPPSRVIYSRRRGRAVWFPEAASGKSAFASLRRYHRNQVYAALQIESLGAFIRHEAERGARGEAPAVVEERCIKLAAGILGRLYGGDQSTYRSGSCRAQIERDDLKTPINALRSAYLMPPLA